MSDLPLPAVRSTTGRDGLHLADCNHCWKDHAMTTDRTTASDADFRDRVAAIEAAPEAEEALRERVARAIYSADDAAHRIASGPEPRPRYLGLADAAIAVLRGEQP